MNDLPRVCLLALGTGQMQEMSIFYRAVGIDRELAVVRIEAAGVVSERSRGSRGAIELDGAGT